MTATVRGDDASLDTSLAGQAHEQALEWDRYLEELNRSDSGTPPLGDRDAPEDAGAPARRFTLERVLDGEPPPPPRLAVEQLLLEGDVNIVGGHGGVGKTTMLLHIALCHATGRPVFGTLAVSRPGSVALLVPEDGKAVARHHLDALSEGLDLTPAERSRATERVLIVGDDRPVNLTRDVPQLAATLADHGVTLFVADPLANLLGGEDENDPQIAYTVADNLRRHICRPLSCTAVIAAHLRKPGRENGNAETTVHDLRGSGAWPNSARVTWALSKPKSGASVITLRLVKSNRIPTGAQHDVTLAIDADPDNPAHWRSCRLTDANIGAASLGFTAAVGRAINDNERKALEAIDDVGEPGRRVSWSDWKKESGINPDTLKGVKKRLLRAGLAEAHEFREGKNGEKNYKYVISPAGRDALQSGWDRTSDRVRGCA